MGTPIDLSAEDRAAAAAASTASSPASSAALDAVVASTVQREKVAHCKYFFCYNSFDSI